MSLQAKDYDKIEERFAGERMHDMLGSDLLTLPKNISGPRIIMFSNHLNQAVVLNHPSKRAMSTGYEALFGKFSDGIVLAKDNFRILEKIPRFRNNPNFKYLLIVENLTNGEIDVIEVCHYENLSDIHGYIKPETKFDKKIVGDIIRQGEIITHSNNHDEYGNYMFGVNANVAFLSVTETQEDPVMISEEFANDTTYYQIREINIPINCNDILLNLFGDNDNYRCLPEIGEDITDNGILCAVKKMVNNQSIFSLSWESLKSLQQAEKIYEGKGKIIDIDISINKLDEFNNSDNDYDYRKQLREIYDEQFIYNQNVYRSLSRYVNPRNNYSTSARLKHLHGLAANYINNENPDSVFDIKTKSPSGTLFEFAYLSIKLAYEAKINLGSKLVNLYASKGVVAKIVPRSQMPRDKFGNVADIIINATASISRANPGQNLESELNYINESIVRKIKTFDTIEEKLDLVLKFTYDANEKQGKYLEKTINKMSKHQKEIFIDSIEEDGYICIVQPPLYGTITWEKINQMYNKYEIEMSYVRWTIKYENLKNKTDRYKTAKQWECVKKHYDYAWYNDFSENNKLDIKYVEEYINKNHIDPNDKNAYIWLKDRLKYDNYKDLEEKYTKILESLARKIKILKEPGELTEEEFDSLETYVYEDKNEPGVYYRDYRSGGPVIISKNYILVLRQDPVTGFSARSKGIVNQIGLPIKSSRKEFEEAFSDTPLALGFMEGTNMMRKADPEIYHRYISASGTNPEMGDLLVKNLLTKNPFELHDIDIDKKDIGNDIPALMLYGYLFSLGLTSFNSDEEDVYEKYDDLDIETNEYFKKKKKGV